MGKDLHKKGIKNITEEKSDKIHCNIRKNITSEIAYPLKTYSSDLNSISNYMRTPSRTNLEP